MSIFSLVSKFIKTNASSILTGGAIAGVVVTAVSAVKAAPKLVEHADIAKRVRKEMEADGASKNEMRVQSVYNGIVYLKDLAPTIVAGAGTVGCILGLNKFHTHKEAALAAAGVLAEQSYKDLLSVAPDNVPKELNRSKVLSDIENRALPLYPGNGDILVCEAYTGQIFWCTKDKVAIAEDKCRERLSKTDECTINYFLQWLGQKDTPAGRTAGWVRNKRKNGFIDMQGVDWINFRHDSFILEDGVTVVLLIDYSIDTYPGIIYNE